MNVKKRSARDVFQFPTSTVSSHYAVTAPLTAGLRATSTRRPSFHCPLPHKVRLPATGLSRLIACQPMHCHIKYASRTGDSWSANASGDCRGHLFMQLSHTFKFCRLVRAGLLSLIAYRRCVSFNLSRQERSLILRLPDMPAFRALA